MASVTKLRATFVILNKAVYAGGSGVAVWRDTSNARLYVATAYHVVEGANSGSGELVLIDSAMRKYTTVTPVILDRTYDFALLEVTGVPSSIPVVTVQSTYAEPIGKGADVYMIGYPLLYDTLSVSGGSVRSEAWTANGVMNQILVSAPCFGGNSGGGVFLKSNHRLIGLVSWGIVDQETFSGLIPYRVVYEAILYFMYRPALSFSVPSLVSYESYFFGAQGYLIDPFLMDDLAPQDPRLVSHGAAGTIVVSVAENSPASAAGFATAPNYSNFQIVWGVSRTNSDSYTWITEERSLDSILFSLAQTSAHSRRSILNRRSQGQAAYAGLDIVLPAQLDVKMLVSSVIDGVHDQTFTDRTVTLVKRHVYYAANGSEDPSTFGNEYLTKRRVAVWGGGDGQRLAKMRTVCETMKAITEASAPA